jgi:hypothetical protein
MRIGYPRAALAGGLALIALGVLVTLSRAPAVTAKGAGILPETQFVATSSAASGCQQGESLPAHTTAIRLGLFAITTPEVKVQVFAGARTAGARTVAEGRLAPGWAGEGATVAVNRVFARTVAPVTVCFSVTNVNAPVQMVGRKVPPSEATVGGGRPLPGRISIQYVQPGHRSWWSLALTVARHLGLGRADSGTGNALLVAVLAAAVLALSSWLVARELR